jgi:uncharacterized protein
MMRIAGALSGPLIIFVSATVITGQIRAAEGGPPAEAKLGQDNAADELRKDAEKGNVKAQYVLGCCYNGEHGFTRDPVKAVKWWGIAAANGVADAQFLLGLSCFLGDGVLKDPVKAAKWWRKAADQDHPDAQYFLGLSYHTGIGVPKSMPLATYWLQKSANQGSSAAIKLLREIGSSPD